MSYYKIKYSKDAEKFLKKNKLYGLKFYKAFDKISKDLNKASFYDIKKYYDKDFDDIYRLRIGKYRAVFRVIKEEILVFLFDIFSFE